MSDDKVEGFIATDEFGVPYSQYVSETPYVERGVLPKRVGGEILRELTNRCRGNIANMAFIDDATFNTDLKQLYALPQRQISENNPLVSKRQAKNKRK